MAKRGGRPRPAVGKAADQPVECGCGKTLFRTQAAAIGAALRASRRSGDALRVYPCPGGTGGWHLTKKRRWYPAPDSTADPPPQA